MNIPHPFGDSAVLLSIVVSLFQGVGFNDMFCSVEVLSSPLVSESNLDRNDTCELVCSLVSAAAKYAYCAPRDGS